MKFEINCLTKNEGVRIVHRAENELIVSQSGLKLLAIYFTILIILWVQNKRRFYGNVCLFGQQHQPKSNLNFFPTCLQMAIFVIFVELNYTILCKTEKL